MAFSRAQSKIRAIEKKQYRARVQSRLADINFKAKHPDWCRDANLTNPIYTLINKQVKEACEKKQHEHQRFREKLHEIK